MKAIIDEYAGMTPAERVKYIGSKMTAKWRKQTMEEFRKEYGAWYFFSGVSVRAKKTWLEQYRKKGV
tara:strand:- start:207 stop:407 length:201 start_codon:yes stop_codon:yes gene_type:complete